MTPLDLARHLAGPVGTLGASFYFDAGTAARAEELGLNVYEFYGLGRAGVLGDVASDDVAAAFHFFHPRTINFLWTAARAKADPAAIATEHVEAAYAFADRTFGGLDPALLAEVAAAAKRASDADESGRHALADGYRRVAPPLDPIHGAYLGMIRLRELRGGVHIEAVVEAGLTPAQACYLEDASIFSLHGYGDADVPEVTPAMSAAKVAAEAATDEAMAVFFGALDDDGRASLARGVDAMLAALSDPVARTR